MEDDGELVQLYIYDLSKGLAAQLSMQFLGKWIEAVYHTAVVVGGVETYYGGGIQEAAPGRTPHGHPMRILDIGRTQVPSFVRQEFLIDISDRYSPERYSLLNNNCNNFSDEFMQFLTGQGIPPHITSLPAEVMATPFGRQLLPMLTGMEASLTSADQRQHAVTRQHPYPTSLSATYMHPGSSTPHLHIPSTTASPALEALAVQPALAVTAEMTSERLASSCQTPVRQVVPSAEQSSDRRKSKTVAAPPDGGMTPVVSTPGAASSSLPAAPAMTESFRQAHFQSLMSEQFAKLRSKGVPPNQAAQQALVFATQQSHDAA